MYLNDHQRSAFYESIGLETTKFNRSVAAHYRLSKILDSCDFTLQIFGLERAASISARFSNMGSSLVSRVYEWHQSVDRKVVIILAGLL